MIAPAKVRALRGLGHPGRDAISLARMGAEIRASLSAQPLPWLPSKYFYDDRGSALFEQITRLPEYYPTRTEEGILERIAGDVVAATRPAELCELGSGVGRKVRLLLDAGRALGTLKRCALLDINAMVLAKSVRRLTRDYPGLRVRGVVGDFQDDLAALGPGGGRLALFLAGTFGNLHPERERPAFLRALARQLAPGDAFLMGVDLVKDEGRLHAAYNDSAGVTAEFNRNILRVVNAALDADFDPNAYDHVAFYDRDHAWIEMRLRARSDQRVRVPAAGVNLTLRRGQEIRTELSCKFTRASVEALLAGKSLRLESWLTDASSSFALALIRRTA
jgi:L-histidine N-alpha-methyltransferase